MKRTVLTFGLIAGLVVSTTMAIAMALMAKNPEMGTGSMVVGYLSMLIAFSFIYVGVKNYRDKQQDGTITFGKAFKIGFFIALIASTMYVIMWALMYNFYMPDYMDKYAAKMIEQAKATSTAAELQEKTAEMERNKEMYKKPVFFTLFTYAEILPVGLIVSLITALILKRKNGKRRVAMA